MAAAASHQQQHRHPKRRRLALALTTSPTPDAAPPLDALADELLFLVLDRVAVTDPRALKSFALASRACHAAESRHRRAVRPLRADLLPAALARYPCATRLDLSLCARVPDAALSSSSCSASAIRAVDLSRSRGFGAAGVAALTSSCPELADLDLSNGVDLGDAAAAEVARAKGLRRLSLARWKPLTDMGLGCVAVGCAELRQLSLKWCLGVTDLGIQLLALKCRKLTSLDLSYTMITKDSFPAIMKLPNLQELTLVGCIGIDDDALCSLEKECSKSLQVLDLSQCQNITDVGVSSIMKSVPNLLELDLSFCCPVTPMVRSFQKIPKLRTLKLEGCKFMADGLKAIGTSCVSLRELSLSKCCGVTDTELSFTMSRLKNLLKLDITCCRNITDVSLEAITSSCTSLISLRMESCSRVSSNALQLIGKHCSHLEELDLTDSDLDDEGLKALARCSKLSSLKIGICLKISDEGLTHIGRSCPKLRDIDLYRCGGLSDDGIIQIAQGCPMLESINLSYCTEITDRSLISLSKCTKLNTLEIRGCPMITSTGLSEIAMGCRLLSKLDIKKCFEINDVGMLYLSQFSHSLRQNMTIVHLAGITPNGLTATLMLCGCLTKVKLHEAFKSMVPPHMIKNVEARGCVFQWIDKPFKVEMEPCDVWKQQSQNVLVR
ncbi:unnamed protein product [Miscanthus lutarioriparius]|uniref:F-box/LRR-repeat protein 15-like leucin rich repeat domain-containing protein n=1 Tax=Miscanthus lutarioriparius TaxID=422564 RepID=A0A811RG12_9POAL|nr:unnamed protein product [Miscanthus lutarioriparius]